MTSYTTGMMTTVDKLRQKKTKTTKSETITIGEKRRKDAKWQQKKDSFRSEYSISTIFSAC